MTLRLNLKKKWYDMIASGEKKQEYREIKEYWLTRFTVPVELNIHNMKSIFPGTKKTEFEMWVMHFHDIQFRNGYASSCPTMIVECNGISIGTGKEEWGAEPGKEYFVIDLGKIISNS